jgi:hypothetical protein
VKLLYANQKAHTVRRLSCVSLVSSQAQTFGVPVSWRGRCGRWLASIPFKALLLLTALLLSSVVNTAQGQKQASPTVAPANSNSAETTSAPTTSSPTTASPSTSPTEWTPCTLARCSDCLLAGYTESGVYSLTHGHGTPVATYCDMTTDNGGWMLVRPHPFTARMNRSTRADFRAVLRGCNHPVITPRILACQVLAYGRTAGSNPSLSTASLPTSPEAGTSHQYMTTLGYTSNADANIAEVRTTRVLALVIVDLVDSHGRWNRPSLQTTPDATR